MKVLFLDEPLVFSCIPRNYNIGTLSLTLRNELSDVVITPAFTYNIDRLLTIAITTQPTDFAIQNKYEITVKSDSNTIYLGKLLVLKQETDIQNYEYNTQKDEYFQFKE